MAVAGCDDVDDGPSRSGARMAGSAPGAAMSLSESMLLTALRGHGPSGEGCRARRHHLRRIHRGTGRFPRRHAAAGDGGSRGGRRQGRDPARQGRRAAYLRRQQRGSVFRPRLRHGAGPAVADGPPAPPRARAAGRDPRVRLCRQRHRPSDRGHRRDGRRASRPDGRGRPTGSSPPWSAGINRRIEIAGADLPVEFRLLDYAPAPFTVRDIVAIARGLWWSLNGRIDRIVAAEAGWLLPSGIAGALSHPGSVGAHRPWRRRWPCASRGTDDATGSNNWALAGFADRHRPCRCSAGDPHQPFWVPSSWYEFALHGPEDRRRRRRPSRLARPVVGQQRHRRLERSPTTRPRRAICTASRPTPPIPGDIATAIPGALSRNARSRSRFAARPRARLTLRSTVRGPVVNDLVTPIGRRAIRRCRCAGLAASIWTTCVLWSRCPAQSDWAGFRARPPRLVGGGVQLHLRRCGGQYRLPDGRRVPLRGRVTPGFPRRGQSGGPVARHHSLRRAAQRLQSGRRLCRQRQSAHRQPTSFRSRSMALIRKAIAACDIDAGVRHCPGSWPAGQHRPAERCRKASGASGNTPHILHHLAGSDDPGAADDRGDPVRMGLPLSRSTATRRQCSKPSWRYGKDGCSRNICRRG